MKCPKCRAENTSDSEFCKKCAAPLPTAKESDFRQTETLQTPVRELTTGSTFAGRYQIIEELGKGGMGRVYKVFDTTIKDKIALKLIKPGIAADRETIDRFSNELRLSRKIGHRNVCRMFDIAEAEGAHFITMEYVHGEDLKSLIEMSGSLSLGMILSVGKQVCDGLAEAHGLGVVHRDLKPQNIMIDKHGNAKIMDFGIARSVRDKGMTGAGTMIGTPEYMSPEQAEAKEVDQRSDIYSLGIILYEMATSRVPFEGDTALAIAMKHKGEAPTNPKQFNPSIPDDLGGLILKCLEKDKAKRYQSASDVHAELEKIEKGIPTTERIVPDKKPLTSREITLKFSLKKIRIPALAAVVVIAGGLAAWRLLSVKTSQPAAAPAPKISIAVLSFTDNSPAENSADLSAGMDETIAGKLRDLGRIEVKSPYEVQRFRGSAKDLKTIGQEIKATHLLTGTVAVDGDNVQVRVFLNDASTGNVLWPGSFEGKMTGFFDIQNRMAERIVAALQIGLTPQDRKILEKSPAKNLEAYRHFWQGRALWAKREEKAFQTAIEYFKKAIALDPEYALAYAGLADVYTLLTPVTPETMREAKNAALEAIRLDDSLAEAHASLGLIKLQHEYDFKGAEEEFLKAVKLDPGYATAHQWYGRLLMMRGRHDEAIAETKRAVDIDPSNSVFLQNLGTAYFLSRRYEEAIVLYKQALALKPDSLSTFMNLIDNLCFAQRYQEALDLCSQPPFRDAQMGILCLWVKSEVRFFQGEKEGLSDFLHTYGPIIGSSSPTMAMNAFAALGDLDQAFFWAEKAVETHDWGILYVNVSPLLDRWRADPRFKTLLKKIGLAD